ncbi:uncharacterized protein B0I36DRAFT_313019 [Microdochium trichocladiopsis]|uniref:Uncharacterized protein n=1 Tax=Microdochium trichocladiopsis TaxID=1682393 RepID=A0A9P8YJB6_9PEZI|nr:uncharacterized protein B0I36DRAFT_313019 [Microdochium trichocladiopsis]KAH7041556.1 hypothetical protein B0I36DRAFT_313019 [Microdochium trichocladiopsis]
MATSEDEHKQKPAEGQDVQMTSDDISQEELQLEQALRHLKLLHIKSRGLRTTIPRMLDTITTGRTPEEVFSTFKTAVTDAQTEIRDFAELYNSEESRKVLEQAQKSREAEPKGIKPWRHKDDPNWFFLDE